MKIVSGHFKGRNFYPSKGSTARPTSNIIREALFNIIYDEIVGAEIIDLFSGSGGIGLESLSRDAGFVHFVDADRKNIKSIEHYLNEYNVSEENYNLYAMDFRRALRKMIVNGIKANIMYVDPPYNEGLYMDVLKLSQECLAENALIILEHEKRVTFEIPTDYTLQEARKYGSKIITILRYTGEKLC